MLREQRRTVLAATRSGSASRHLKRLAALFSLQSVWSLKTNETNDWTASVASRIIRFGQVGSYRQVRISLK